MKVKKAVSGGGPVTVGRNVPRRAVKHFLDFGLRASIALHFVFDVVVVAACMLSRTRPAALCNQVLPLMYWVGGSNHTRHQYWCFSIFTGELCSQHVSAS